jgi:phage terminase small subunit
MPLPRAPRGLGPDGRKFWRSVTSEYLLSPAELGILARACRCLDRLSAMDDELAAAGSMITAGSTGQEKPHPLLASLDQAERTLDVLIRALALPLPDEKQGKRRSPSAAMAARVRWDARTGV